MTIINLKNVNAGKTVYPPLKAGHYLAEIIDTQAKNISQDRGKLLEVKLRVVQGTAVDRYLYDWILIGHIDQKEVEKAERKLARLARAILGDLMEEGPIDSEDLHHIPLIVEVTLKKGTNDNPDRNYIRSYKPASDAETIVLA